MDELLATSEVLKAGSAAADGGEARKRTCSGMAACSRRCRSQRKHPINPKQTNCWLANRFSLRWPVRRLWETSTRAWKGSLINRVSHGLRRLQRKCRDGVFRTNVLCVLYGDFNASRAQGVSTHRCRIRELKRYYRGHPWGLPYRFRCILYGDFNASRLQGASTHRCRIREVKRYYRAIHGAFHTGFGVFYMETSTQVEYRVRPHIGVGFGNSNTITGAIHGAFEPSSHCKKRILHLDATSHWSEISVQLFTEFKTPFLLISINRLFQERYNWNSVSIWTEKIQTNDLISVASEFQIFFLQCRNFQVHGINPQQPKVFGVKFSWREIWRIFLRNFKLLEMPKLLNFSFPKGWYFLYFDNTELERSSKIHLSVSERHRWALVS